VLCCHSGADVVCSPIPRPPVPTLFPTRRSSDLAVKAQAIVQSALAACKSLPKSQFTGCVVQQVQAAVNAVTASFTAPTRLEEGRSEEHTSELQSHLNLVCRLLLEKKKKNAQTAV